MYGNGRNIYLVVEKISEVYKQLLTANIALDVGGSYLKNLKMKCFWHGPKRNVSHHLQERTFYSSL